MGLAAELGYTVAPPNRAQRLVQAFGATRPGSILFSKVLPPLDRRLAKATKGRHSVPGLLAGLPVLEIGNVGAKSGQLRTTPLMGFPLRGDLALVGSNFGQAQPPAWTFNLAANPKATVAYGGRTVDVEATIADQEDTDAVLDLAAAVYPGYAKYRERVTERPIHVYVLRPVDSSGPNGSSTS